jgi:hypothetical protein
MNNPPALQPLVRLMEDILSEIDAVKEALADSEGALRRCEAAARRCETTLRDCFPTMTKSPKDTRQHKPARALGPFADCVEKPTDDQKLLCPTGSLLTLDRCSNGNAINRSGLDNHGTVRAGNCIWDASAQEQTYSHPSLFSS